MPQLTFIPVSEPTARQTCQGGCGRILPLDRLIETPEGRMCEQCRNDLYLVCESCNLHMRRDTYGEVENARHVPPSRCFCQACFEREFVCCEWCGQFGSPEHDNYRPAPVATADPRGGPELSGLFCTHCWDNNWVQCDRCETIVSRRESRGVNLEGVEEEYLCDDCFQRDYIACAVCGGTLLPDNYCGWEGDPHCEHCYGNADVWKVQPWTRGPGSYNRIISHRRFGVEIETENCEGWRGLQKHTQWGCVYECSTPGREFVSPILQGDNGLAEVEEFCGRADDLGWTVDSSCGLHIHLDISKESSDTCLRIAYAYRLTYPLWKRLVHRSRRTLSMCGSPQYTARDVREAEHIEDFAEARDRFEFVNWRAYLRHGSFEVRLYQGTLNGREICNWIKLHAYFMDAVKEMTFDEIRAKFGAITRKNWEGLNSVIDDADLLDYWRRKAARCGTDLAVLDEGMDALEEAEETPPVPQWLRDVGGCDCENCRALRGEL